MKRNNDSDLQRDNNPSKTKRANVATINSNPAILSTAEVSVITQYVVPSFHRTLMQLCRENLQIEGSVTADLAIPKHGGSPPGLCHEPILPLPILTNQKRKSIGMIDEHQARSSHLSNLASNYVSEVPLQMAGRVRPYQFKNDMTRMPQIQPHQEDQQRAASLSIAAILMNSDTRRISHFDQIAPDMGHLAGRFTDPFRTNFPMNSLNELLESNQNRIMNRITHMQMPFEYKAVPRSCATSLPLGATTDWVSSNQTHNYDSSRETTAKVLETAIQMTDRVTAESGGVQPPYTTNILSMLPSCVTTPIDFYKLSPHQCLLREQIEYFEATDVDAMIPIRGRNKQITIGQVGIRCKNCAHVPMSRRQKGSTYFPSNKLGIYQAAQNMSTTHLQCGLCIHTPASIKNQFATIMMDRQRNDNGAGRPYWAKSATQSGFIDTEEHGIRFIRSALPLGACVTEKDLKILEA